MENATGASSQLYEGYHEETWDSHSLGNSNPGLSLQSVRWALPCRKTTRTMVAIKTCRCWLSETRRTPWLFQKAMLVLISVFEDNKA
ncbi:hypothetical protein J1N35_011949 [Gossypium stocksii]|uniref:Uncharacterized protein n=1 Tax=Gossypium stocksii TaxID=47602 RepID=A0A9D4AE27_9ROSI|nr:hypothetical protein J1N35_011949 [Gossypium stocksii]